MLAPIIFYSSHGRSFIVATVFGLFCLAAKKRRWFQYPTAVESLRDGTHLLSNVCTVICLVNVKLRVIECRAYTICVEREGIMETLSVQIKRAGIILFSIVRRTQVKVSYALRIG